MIAGASTPNPNRVDPARQGPGNRAARLHPWPSLALTVAVGLLCTLFVLVGEQSNLFPRSAPAPLAGGVTGRPLPLYEMKVDPIALQQMDRDPYSDQTHPATFSAEGKQFSVQIRYRGAWARSWPKRPFKIFFEDGHEFRENHCLNLNSAWRDPAFIREPLAYQVYTACGVPAPATRLIRLNLNGRFFGLYVEVEQPDKPLLKRHGLKGSSIYKANSRVNRSDQRELGPESAYAAHYEKETHKGEGFRDLQEFCHELATATNVVEFFTRRVDIAEYVNYLCVNALVQNWDCFNKNHFLAHDVRGSDKWLVLPWDLDRTFGDHWHGSFTEARLPLLLGTKPLPGPTGWNRMADRFLHEPSFRSRFVVRLRELLEKEFTKEKLFPIIDQWEADIRTEAVRDRQRWPADASDLRAGIVDLKAFIERRRAYLLREIARLQPELK